MKALTQNRKSLIPQSDARLQMCQRTRSSARQLETRPGESSDRTLSATDRSKAAGCCIVIDAGILGNRNRG
jgi:hypothetical protein